MLGIASFIEIIWKIVQVVHKHCIILYKGLEHLWILVFARGLKIAEVQKDYFSY